jgi:hypothetical protein
MEEWLRVFEGVIPVGEYNPEVKHDNESGLVIVLKNANCVVKIDFGVVVAFRLLDEGVILNKHYSDSDISRLKDNGFPNTIYQIQEGEFANFVKKIGNEMYDYLDMRHYIIITLNHVFEVISEWEPEVTLTS